MGDQQKIRPQRNTVKKETLQNDGASCSVTPIENNNQDRPQDLNFPKKKLIEGRQFFDLSDETVDVADADNQQQQQLRHQHEDERDGCLALDSSTEAIKEDDIANLHLVALVAEDFEERIRMSGSSGANTAASSSTSSTSAPVGATGDVQLLNDLESHAKQIAVQLDRILVEFNGSLNGMTELTVDCSTVYTNSVKKTCDTVDSTIKSMYQMLAKSEELLHTLKTLPALAKQIREIKRLLDLFESHMQKSHG